MGNNDGGPAFPMSGDPGVEFDRGMSLLDHFAGLAMAAIIAKTPLATTHNSDDRRYEAAAVGAYNYAKAMLRERIRTE